MRVKSQYEFPEVVAGAELSPRYGFLSVIVPEATTNLVNNPSVETGTTNWAASGAGVTIARVATWQTHGAYGLRIATASGVESGVYFGSTTPIALTAGQVYTASIDFKGDMGKLYYIWFGTTGGSLVGLNKPIIATGRKQRIFVTYHETSSTSRRIYITRDARYTDTNYFYVDALLVENKGYPTTYCDGDMKGTKFIPGFTAYGWNGQPHASTSWRSAQTRSGGKEVNLLDLGLRILAIVGLGMTPLTDLATPLSGVGEYYQGTGTGPREFNLAAALTGSTLRYLQQQRRDLIDIFKPDAYSYQQPLVLRYQACDPDDGEPTSDPLDIHCVYQSGLEGVLDNEHQERVNLHFKMHLPWLQSSFGEGTSLGYQTTVTNFANLGYRDIDGTWYPMSTGANDSIQKILVARSGLVYVFGAYTSIGGVATRGAAVWNGTGFAALGSGAADGMVYTAVEGPDGSIYVGGNFSQMGGVANTAGIARWGTDGAWHAVGLGITLGADIGYKRVYGMAIDQNGGVWAVGLYGEMGGVANTYSIARYYGGAWSSVSSGLSGGVIPSFLYFVVVSPGNEIVVGGGFDTINGVSASYVARRDTAGTWHAMGAGLNGAPSSAAYDAHGDLFVGGDFTTAGGTAAPKIASWNGVSWRRYDTFDNTVEVIARGPDNQMYTGGHFTTIGGYLLPDRGAVYTGSVFLPIDINVQDVNAYFYTYAWDKYGRMYLGGLWTGSNALSATVTVPNISGAETWPVIKITGAGTIYQIKNYNTGKTIHFNSLVLMAGETAVLDLTPGNLSFVSDFRGDLMNYIGKGSDLSFSLMPGNNNISVHILQADGSCGVVMAWVPNKHGIDGAVP